MNLINVCSPLHQTPSRSSLQHCLDGRSSACVARATAECSLLEHQPASTRRLTRAPRRRPPPCLHCTRLLSSITRTASLCAHPPNPVPQATAEPARSSRFPRSPVSCLAMLCEESVDCTTTEQLGIGYPQARTVSCCSPSLNLLIAQGSAPTYHTSTTAHTYHSVDTELDRRRRLAHVSCIYPLQGL